MRKVMLESAKKIVNPNKTEVEPSTTLGGIVTLMPDPDPMSHCILH